MNNIADVTAPIRLAEQGEPSADGRAFRRCLGQFATGVAVITVNQENRPVGMAVNSFAAVSLDPPLVLWSIRRESGSAPAFLNAAHFAVSILSASQVETSQLFGAPHPDRFSQIGWKPGREGVPLIDRAIAHLECQLEHIHEGGDHLILVGRVNRYARFEGEPLLFAQGQYAVAQNHPRLTPPSTIKETPAANSHNELFMTLLKAASQHMSALFEEHRQAVGLNVASGRILNRLSVGPCDLKDLERDTYLGQNAIEDAIGDLIDQGFLLKNRDSLFELTDMGQKKREELTKRAEEFTSKKLDGISEIDIAKSKRVLIELLQR